MRGIHGNGGDVEGQREHGETRGDMRGTRRDMGSGGDMRHRAGHWGDSMMGCGVCASVSPPIQGTGGQWHSQCGCWRWQWVPRVSRGSPCWAVCRSSSVQQLYLPREAGRSGCPSPRSPAGTPRMMGPPCGHVPGLWVLLAKGALGVLLGCSGCLHRGVWVSFLRVWVLWGVLGVFIGCLVGSGCPFIGFGCAGLPWVSLQNVWDVTQGTLSPSCLPGNRISLPRCCCAQAG